jgi:hypothetical protein
VRATLDGRLSERRIALTSEADALPTAIGEASSRVRGLSTAIANAQDDAQPALSKRLAEEVALVRAQEARLAELRGELEALAGVEAESAWIERALTRFDGMWDALTDANRVALVRAVIDEVVLDVEGEQVRIALAGADRARATPIRGARAR